MSLQGTFDTLSVTELFGLLSTAGKTGALRLEAPEHVASVLVSGGRCCGVESDEIADPAGSDAELATRLVDVGFSFARSASGAFRFSDSEPGATDPAVTTPLEPAVVEIRALLDQWREIETTIPSLDVRVRLAPVLRDDEIVVSAAEWALLVALEGSPSVRDLVARRRQPMMQVCLELKALADRGAVEVGADLGATVSLIEPIEPYAAGPEVTGAEPVPDGLVAMATDSEAIAVDADAVAAGIVSRMARSRQSVPDVFAGEEDSLGGDAADESDDVVIGTIGTAAEAGEVPQDRGALLRLFSALKET